MNSDDSHDSRRQPSSGSVGSSAGVGGIALRLSASTHREVTSLHNSRSSNRSSSSSNKQQQQQYHNYHHRQQQQRDSLSSEDDSDRESNRGRSRSRSNSPAGYHPQQQSVSSQSSGDTRRCKEVRWTHKPLLLGKKSSVQLHFCDACDRPIQSFGRLLPCKHAACRTCAQSSKCCPRCQDPVEDTEVVSAAQLHVCMHDASAPHSRSGCKRTYLSQRDLLAHIEHRHGGGAKLAAETAAASLPLPPMPLQQQQQQQQQQQHMQQPQMMMQQPMTMPQYLPMSVSASSGPGVVGQGNPLLHNNPYQQQLQLPPPMNQQQQQQLAFRPPMRPPGMLPPPPQSVYAAPPNTGQGLLQPPAQGPPGFHHHQQQQHRPSHQMSPHQMPPPQMQQHSMGMPLRPPPMPPMWANQQQPNRFHGV